jgi:hypothetical protein
VILTVDAFDAQYQPLAEDKIPGHKLQGQWEWTDEGRERGEEEKGRRGEGEKGKPSTTVSPSPLLPFSPSSAVRPLAIPQLSEGVFETRLGPLVPGEHSVQVTDPVTQERVVTTFRVTGVSVEDERAVRNTVLERDLAAVTGGKSYDLVTVGQLPDEIRLVSKTETNVHVVELWNTWLLFGLVGFFMLGEWLGRKRANLP